MDTRTRIVEAAMQLVADHGYVGATTKGIAEAAGVNEVTVFRHFGSKASILAEIGLRLAAHSGATHLPPPPVPNLRAVLHDIALREERGARLHGRLALRLAIDAQVVPEVRAALASELGPGANLERLTEFFLAHQHSGQVRSDIPAASIAEGFAHLSSTLTMARDFLQYDRHDDNPNRSPVRDLVEVFCDGIGVAATQQPLDENS